MQWWSSRQLQILIFSVAAAPAVYAHAPVVAPAVAPAVHVAAAPLPYVGPTLSHSPVVTSVKAVEVKPAEVEVEAPKVISYAAPAVYHHAPAVVPAAGMYLQSFNDMAEGNLFLSLLDYKFIDAHCPVPTCKFLTN